MLDVTAVAQIETTVWCAINDAFWNKLMAAVLLSCRRDVMRLFREQQCWTDCYFTHVHTQVGQNKHKFVHLEETTEFAYPSHLKNVSKMSIVNNFQINEIKKTTLSFIDSMIRATIFL